MEAQCRSALRVSGQTAAWALCCLAATAGAAGYRTTNFVVDAPTPQLAKEIGDAAEHYRKSLSQEWLGKELPPWAQACPVKALVGPQLGAGGATSFIFDRGEVFGWKMDIQGSRERILDSVLPHEITHTVFATHFRQPLPRWADEGACTTVEHRSEIAKQEQWLITFLKTGRGIPFSEMFAMKEYPPEVLPLYAQGHSLARYLIDQRGKRAFLNFLADGMRDENWPRAVRAHYQYEHLLALQQSWLNWVRAGRPPLQPTDGTMLAMNEAAEQPATLGATGAAMAARGGPTRSPQQSPSGSGIVAAAAELPDGAAAAVHAPAPGRSVYGEKASWQPARPRPRQSAAAAAPPPTAGVAYDAARPGVSVWR